jgi:hypothetical protein
MKNLLEIHKDVLTISPEALMIQEFKTIWNRDKSKSKDKAKKELAYVYHTIDYQSVYRNYHVDTRESKIRLDVMGKREWEPDEKIQQAQLKYAELQTTLSMQILMDIERGINKLRTYFINANFDEDEDGRAAKNFIANVKEMGNLVKGVKALKEEVEKELTDAMQLRGQGSIGRRELPPERRA